MGAKIAQVRRQRLRPPRHAPAYGRRHGNFLHKRHRDAVSGLDCSYAATGFLKQGNKGGVAARFVIYNRSLAFVVAHLSASDENVERRNEDFKEIVRKAVFIPSGALSADCDGQLVRQDPTDALRKNFADLLSGDFKSPGNHTHRVSSIAAAAANVLVDLKEGGDSKALEDPDHINILDHDVVVWVGDLNYRIDATPTRVLEWVKTENWSALQSADQLNKERLTYGCFKGFEEAPITFPPTYKMYKDCHEYSRDENGILKRTPSYTDRILWCTETKLARKRDPTREPPSVTAVDYKSVPILSSDHRPVYALLAVRFDASNGQVPENGVGPSGPLVRRPPRPREGKPEIEFSETELDFEEAPPNLILRKTLSVKNRGRNDALIAIPAWQELPVWLSIQNEGFGAKKKLAANSVIELTFEVQLCKDKRFKDTILDPGIKLDVPVNILVEPMLIKHKVQVKVRARNSCYGMAINELILYKMPIAFLEAPRSYSSASSSSSGSDNAAHDLGRAPLSVPKEVWLLTDVLLRQQARRNDRHGSSGAYVFLKTASPSAWGDVLAALDYGNEFVRDVDDTAVATCLVELLNALPEPVLPRVAYAATMAAAQKRSGSALRRSLSSVPDVNFSLLIYVLSFIAELALAWSPAEQSKVATVFAKTALLGRHSSSEERILERTALITFVMEEYATGRFTPKGVFDLSGCDVYPEGELSRSRRWKERAGKKMKRVFR